MYQLFVILLLGTAFAAEEEEPFSIGLGTLSPSYSQRVGKENVKVTFNQKENGQYSYTVGDPQGTNTYLNFGASGNNAAPQQASSFASPQQAFQAPSYAAPQQAYQAPSYSAPQQAYQGPSYSAPQQAYQAPSYAAPQQAYQAPSYAAPQQDAREPGFMPAGFSYHATEGQAYLRQGGELRKPDPSPSQIMPAGFSYHATEGQSFLRQSEARKPEPSQGQVLPAGFSYHAMEGQSFLRQGESPNFMIGNDRQQGSARGPAEQSFFTQFQGQQGGQGLANGLVGYGRGGPRGSLPIGGYAGSQHSGTFKDHGGHE